MRFFTRAVLRRPGSNFVDAISQSAVRQRPNYLKALAEHNQYAQAIKNTGIDVSVCEADEDFPDGMFVEDPFLILGKKMIIELNPGALSRQKEYTTLRPFLPQDVPYVALSKNATIDGGDILKDGKIIYVGESTRTQKKAIEGLTSIVQPLGYQVISFPVPKDLHLKSGMTCIQPHNFVIQEFFEDTIKNLQQANPGIQYFVVPENEYFAANVLPINGKILMPTGCPETKAYIAQFYNEDDIEEVDTAEARLVDGALTCSSLLFK